MWLCSLYDPAAVIAAATISFAVVIGLTVYAWTTKTDFTTFRGILVAAIVGVIFFSIAIAINTSGAVNLVFVLIIIIIYGVFIVYDTQLIAGGRHRELNYDDYVIGALLLYIDIIGLFIYILSFIGGKR